MMGGDTIAIPMTNSPSVAILGEALIDFKATGPLAFQGFVGGSSLNVAVAVARQQQPVVFLTQISRDLLGAPIKQHRALLEGGAEVVDGCLDHGVQQWVPGCDEGGVGEPVGVHA